MDASEGDAASRELDDARADLANLVRRRDAIAAVIRDRDTLRAPLLAPSTGIVAASFAAAGQIVDEQQKLSRALRTSVEGNLWIASRAVPMLKDLHAIRIWAGMNVNIDRAPILGEVPGLPGFYNCVSSNGYTLAPVLSRLTAEMIAGRATSLPVWSLTSHST